MPRRNHISKPPKHPPRAQPCTKQPYASRGAAQRAIAQRLDPDVDLRCYLCSNCGKWHLTSQNI